MVNLSPYCIERYGVECLTLGPEVAAAHDAVGWSA